MKYLYWLVENIIYGLLVYSGVLRHSIYASILLVGITYLLCMALFLFSGSGGYNYFKSELSTKELEKINNYSSPLNLTVFSSFVFIVIFTTFGWFGLAAASVVNLFNYFHFRKNIEVILEIKRGK